jgi:hypothetical protein
MPSSPPRSTLTHRVAFALRLLAPLLVIPGQAQTSTPATTSPPAEEAALDPKDEANFPYLINIATEIDRTGFKRGDGVTITSVRGTRPTLEVGGTYRVEGTYTLANAAVGQVSLSITTSRDVGGVPVSRLQFYDIEKGRGSFILVKKFSVPGEFRVALNYPEPGQKLKKDSSGNVIRSYGPSRGSVHFRQR